MPNRSYAVFDLAAIKAHDRWPHSVPKVAIWRQTIADVDALIGEVERSHRAIEALLLELENGPSFKSGMDEFESLLSAEQLERIKHTRHQSAERAARGVEVRRSFGADLKGK